MNLIGEKILLRELRETDMPLLNKLINDPNIENYIVGWSKPVSMSEQMLWYQNLKNDSNIRYCIADIKDSKPFGTVIISKIDYKNKSCNIDIKIDPKYHGYGIGSETISLITKYAFEELNFNRITAAVLDYNIASQRIFEKNGFIREGVQRKAIYKLGKYNDLYNYGLIKEDYYK